jgi:OOP family OmpA-OmpF porin
MRKLATLMAGLFLMVTVVGCASFRERRWGMCAVAGGLAGGTLGAVGGGVGTYNISGHTPGTADPGETAAGAATGMVVGALIGSLLGHVICDPKPEPPPPPPPPPPAPPAKGTKLGTVGEAFFDFDKATLKPGAKDALAETMRVMREHPSLKVVVQGHTDSVGSDAYNQRLSERRAGAVREYLTRQGIDGSRIDTEGFGESRPVASNSTAAGRAQNRRAEIIAE